MEKKGKASAISGAIFLISLGVLLITGWWWPGILIAIGLAGCAELVFRGQIARGIGTLAFFCAIPIIVALVQATNIPWTVVIALVLVGIGVISLVKALYLGGESPENG